MTSVLHLPAQPGAPIACDMSTAVDTPDERLREYGALFERALLRRERQADSLVLTFSAQPDTRQTVDDLARREAACCPFLDYRVETLGERVVWTMTGDGRAKANVTLDAFYALPDHPDADFAGLLDRLDERGFTVGSSGRGSGA